MTNKSKTLIIVPLAVLAVAVLIAFANAWPDNLVLDDKNFVGPLHPPEHDDLIYMFTSDIWATVGSFAGLYRPLLLLDFSLESRLFGDWLIGYHLSNIFRHILAVFLLFGFLRHLLLRAGNSASASGWFAVLAALLYAVHPVQTEVVNSIFNRSDIMVTIWGLGGLWWLLSHLDARPARAWTGLALAYSVALFYKENAAVIPGVAVVLVWLLTEGNFAARVRRILPVFWLLIPLAAYLAMRSYALSGPATQAALNGVENVGFGFVPRPVINPGAENTLAAIGVLGESLKTIVWPYPLHMFYDSPSKLESWLYLGVQLGMLIWAAALLWQKRFIPALGLGFFYVAMLPASRILGGGVIEPHIALRFLYFPSVGLAILLAFALQSVEQRFGRRVSLGVVVPLVLACMAMTWDRNNDWDNELKLFETEYQRGRRGEATLRMVTTAQLRNDNFERAAKICDENRELQQRYGGTGFVHNCALAYEYTNRTADVVLAHEYAKANPLTRMGASLSLARFFLRIGRAQDAEEQFLAALNWSGEEAQKALIEAEMLLSMHPTDRQKGFEARAFIEKALELRPGWPEAEEMLNAVNRALESGSAKENKDQDRRE